MRPSSDSNSDVDLWMRKISEEGYKGCSVSVAAFVSMVHELAAEAAKLVDIAEDDLLGRIENLETLRVIKRSERINGYIEPSDATWQRVSIYVNDGLWMLLAELPLLFLSSVTIKTGGVSSPSGDPRISRQDVIRRTVEILEAYWSGETPPSLMDLQYDDESAQSRIAAQICWSSRQFVVAHELGHLLVHAYPERIGDDITATVHRVGRTYAEYLASLNIDDDLRRAACSKWLDEFAADRVALRLCINLNEHGGVKQVVASAAQLALLVTFLIEKLFEVRYGRSLSELSQEQRRMDHPPTKMRLEVLRGYIREALPDVFGQLFEDIANEASNRL